VGNEKLERLCGKAEAGVDTGVRGERSGKETKQCDDANRESKGLATEETERW
jgi:hypothetical protein